MRAAPLLLAGLLVACAEPDFWAFSSRSGPGAQGGTTFVAVWVSDGPIHDAQALELTFSRTELQGPDGPVVLPGGVREVDLLALTGGRRALLAEGPVAAGTYASFRLVLAADGAKAHRLVLETGDEPLHLARADARVVEIEGPFELRAGERHDLHVDFDLALSVFPAGERWILDPVARLLDGHGGGAIEGRVAGGPGALVSAQAAGRTGASTRADVEGRFYLGPLPAGVWAVVATVPGMAPAVEDGLQVVAGATLRDVTLVAGVPAELRLDGTGPDGVDGVRALLYSGDLLLGVSGVDPRTGAWAFPGLVPGTYSVELRLGDLLLERRTVVVAGP